MWNKVKQNIVSKKRAKLKKQTEMVQREAEWSGVEQSRVRQKKAKNQRNAKKTKQNKKQYREKG